MKYAMKYVNYNISIYFINRVTSREYIPIGQMHDASILATFNQGECYELGRWKYDKGI